jgi:hypothetical protein
MAISEFTPTAAAALPRPSAPVRRSWGAAHYLALVAVPLLAYQAWTLIGWLAAGPHQVTNYRTAGSASWYAARVIQGVMLIAVIAIAVGVVRGCRRERRLTFDAMLFIGLASTVFWDTVVNFVEPLWFYSTNWVNLNDWWAHAPLVLNPAAGHGPFPVLMLGLLYPFFVFGAMIICGVMRRAQQRWPEISRARLIAVALLPASVISATVSLIMISRTCGAVPACRSRSSAASTDTRSASSSTSRSGRPRSPACASSSTTAG